MQLNLDEVVEKDYNQTCRNPNAHEEAEITNIKHVIKDAISFYS